MVLQEVGQCHLGRAVCAVWGHCFMEIRSTTTHLMALAPHSHFCRGQSHLLISFATRLHHEMEYVDHQCHELGCFEVRSPALFHPSGTSGVQHHVEVLFCCLSLSPDMLCCILHLWKANTSDFGVFLCQSDLSPRH